jgi:transposase
LCTEEYTSLTCTYCGYRSKHYNEREKECLKCKKKIDRDINGARNILIKTLYEKELLKEMLGSKPKATSCQKELII